MKPTRALSNPSWLAVALAFAFSARAEAQFFGHNFPGDYGLFAGSQAPPGRYAGFFVPYYRADTVKLEEGIALGGTDDAVDVIAFAPFFSYVSELKIAGGNYGFVIAPSFANANLEIPRLDVDVDQFGVGDLYVVPFQLGWHLERTDMTASYGFFAPTGRYEVGANDNIGLGMWSHELAFGFTQYLDRESTWSFATEAFYEIHTTKRDVDIRAGDWFILEGGVGKEFDGGWRLGAAYYALWQTTDASGADVPADLLGRNIRSFGFGPDVELLQGALVLRALWEFGAQNTLEGFIFFGSLALPF